MDQKKQNQDQRNKKNQIEESGSEAGSLSLVMVLRAGLDTTLLNVMTPHAPELSEPSGFQLSVQKVSDTN